MLKVLFALSLLTLGLPMAARAQSSPEVRQIPSRSVSSAAQAGNFGFVYLVQWGVYYASQEETIREHGSFENWLENPAKPHFDKDHFNWNLGKHTLVGNYYYLFYRSRSYTMREAFEWTFLSSLAFEFTIETITERPSYQDIYQTPIFGSIVGMGAEKLSLYFHSLDTWPTSMLGYLFNPFTILPQSSYELGWQPTIHDGKNAIALSLKADL